MKSFKRYLNSIAINEATYKKGRNAIVTNRMKPHVEGLASELYDVIDKKIWISSAYRDEYDQARVVYGNWKRKGGGSAGNSYLQRLYGNKKLAAKVHDAYDAGTNKKDSIARAERVLLDAIANKNYMSNHQLENAVDISSYVDNQGKKKGLSKAEYKKIKDFVNGGSSSYATKIVDEGDHVHVKLNVTPKNGGNYGKIGKPRSEQPISPDESTPDKTTDLTQKDDVQVKPKEEIKKETKKETLVTNKKSFINKTFEPFIAGLFKNRLKLNITSRGDGTATAVAETINSYYNLDEYITEGLVDNLIKKAVTRHIENKPKRQDKRKARKYKRDMKKWEKGGYVGDAPGKEDMLGGEDKTKDEVKDKATFDIVLDDKTGAYTLMATNLKAINKLDGLTSFKIRDMNDTLLLNKGFGVAGVPTKKVSTDASTASGGIGVALPTIQKQAPISGGAGLNITSFSHLPIGATQVQKSNKGAQIASRLMKDLGLTKEQAAGVAGNLWGESSFYPDRIQGSGTKLGLLADAGNGGYSWAQWTHSSRKKKLKDYATSVGFDLDTQPATDDIAYGFLIKELGGHRSLANLKKAKDVQSATDIVLKQYEKPADTGPSALKKRTDYANSVIQSIDGRAATALAQKEKETAAAALAQKEKETATETA